MEEDLSTEKLAAAQASSQVLKAPSKWESAPKSCVMKGAESRMMVLFILCQMYFIITLIKVIS